MAAKPDDTAGGKKPAPSGPLGKILDEAEEYQRRRGEAPLTDEEAMALAQEAVDEVREERARRGGR